MGDEGPRRSYMISVDPQGHWHSSSIPGHGYSSTSTKDSVSERRKKDNESEKLARVTWIWPGGWDSFKTPSIEFTYVALQGKDSICVVTGDYKLVNKTTNHWWMGLVIGTIKAHYVFGYDQREMGMYLGMVPEDEDLRPFAAVNVVMSSKEVNAESDDEASSVGLNEKKAIAMLMKKMEKRSAFSYEETIQTALSALQHLLKRQLMPSTVKVCVEKKGTGDAQQLTSEEINKHLKVINKPRKALRTVQSPSGQ